ncbi:DUF6123 family protein [Bacillus testis]|uniref:DUF6123 family protein n=1 Tax=Bacillus testis TaxID=1622072 RepID=UPI00067EF7A2|nr:DUF6123 family protein [Bacillus testis]
MTVDQYIEKLSYKGFSFGEDALGFIYFGKELTGSSDLVVNTAIEITLKAQKTFDGSFYVSLLEGLKKEGITTRRAAFRFAESYNLLV